MMTKQLLTTMAAGVVCGSLLVACPVDEGAPRMGMQNAAGSEALAAAIAKARVSEARPKPPALKTLCSLQFGRTDYQQAKKIFGSKPDDESMDKSMAGLSYRYEAEKDGKPIAVTLVLTFAWSDGQVGLGTAIFGIGGDPEDLLTGYILTEASITGMAYPDCWPHEEP